MTCTLSYSPTCFDRVHLLLSPPSPSLPVALDPVFERLEGKLRGFRYPESREPHLATERRFLPEVMAQARENK